MRNRWLLLAFVMSGAGCGGGASGTTAMTGSGGSGGVQSVAGGGSSNGGSGGGSTTPAPDGGSSGGMTPGVDGGTGSSDGGSSGDGGSSDPCDSRVIVNDLSSPIEFRSDGQFVYWVDQYGQRLARASRDGGAAQVITTSFAYSGGTGVPMFALSFEVDDQLIYVAERGFQLNTTPTAQALPGSIRVYDRATGTLQRTITPPQPAGDCSPQMISGLAVTPDRSIYWLQNSDSQGTSCTPATTYASVVRAAPGATSGTILTTANTTSLAATNDAVYWSDDTSLQQLTVGGLQSTVPMSTGQMYVNSVYSDGKTIFWTGSNGLYRTDAAGTSLLLPQSTLPFTPMADNGDTLYSINGNAVVQPNVPFTVYELSKEGGPLIHRADLSDIRAVDDSYLYYVDSTGLNLVRTCK